MCPIAVSVVGHQPHGFQHFWAHYVTGFNPKDHCKLCLRGSSSRHKLLPGTEFVFDERKTYDSLYICGVALGPRNLRAERNLHLPLEPAPGHSVQQQTYTGLLIQVRNARLLPTPPLPDGFMGLGPEFTRCRNFRFGIHRFPQALNS